MSLPLHRLLMPLLLVLAGWLASTPASAQDAEIFTVRNVAVDVTAENAAAAREQALAEGQIEAAREMLQRLTRRQDWGRLPTVDGASVTGLVSNFEVAGERTSNVRYLARLTVRFEPGAVRQTLRQTGVPFAETVSKPVLVLPVLRRDASLLLWDEPNPWRDAWFRLPSREGTLVPMVVPLGDLSDIADISAEQAAAGERTRLSAIAGRYGADDSLVAIATLDIGIGSNLARVDVAVTRVGATAQTPILLDLTASTGQDIDGLLQQAAVETANAVEDAWIEANLLRFDRQQEQVFLVPLSSLQDWVSVRERLGEVALITEARLHKLSRLQAEVAVQYFGEFAQLEDALVQRDLVLDALPQATADDAFQTTGSPRTLRLANRR